MLRVVSIIVVSILISEAISHNLESNNEQEKKFEEILQWLQEIQERSGIDKPVTQVRVNFHDNKQDAGENSNRDSLANQKSRRSIVIRRDTRSANKDPPPVDQAVLMARYVVNQADWTSVATISTRKDIQSFPVANVISFSDGPVGSGSGIPYMYITPLDFTAQDLVKDHRASLLMTLAQGSYCKNKQWDPMDPRCARVILTGKIKGLNDKSVEYQRAKRAVFGRHPHLKNMPPDHDFFFVKLKISAIALLDTFGGPKYIDVKDYLYPPVNNITEAVQHFLLKRQASESLKLLEDSEKNFDTDLDVPIYQAHRIT
ncbi:protein CREG1 [Harpegnathos saltator]|uniref:Protein CREG1 n=1 Tax=Harpegnathos saltator TaxID=610380 RepID=E2B7P0_HARSA|nr:protein CREG1 [Harpegnathos saltator]EFN88318.1 Protein CREG1 [Harpegnathos saltator]